MKPIPGGVTKISHPNEQKFDSYTKKISAKAKHIGDAAGFDAEELRQGYKCVGKNLGDSPRATNGNTPNNGVPKARASRGY